MKKHFPLLFVLVVLLLVSSCGSTDKAQKTADKFFKMIIKGDSAGASKLVHPDLLANRQLLMQELKALGEYESFGKLKSAKKGMGFNTQMNNGVTTVTLPYELKYEDGERSMSVTLIDQGEGFKIASVL